MPNGFQAADGQKEQRAAVIQWLFWYFDDWLITLSQNSLIPAS